MMKFLLPAQMTEHMIAQMILKLSENPTARLIGGYEATQAQFMVMECKQGEVLTWNSANPISAEDAEESIKRQANRLNLAESEIFRIELFFGQLGERPASGSIN